MTFDDEKNLLDAGYFPVFSEDAGRIIGWFVPDGTQFLYTSDGPISCNTGTTITYTSDGPINSKRKAA